GRGPDRDPAAGCDRQALARRGEARAQGARGQGAVAHPGGGCGRDGGGAGARGAGEARAMTGNRLIVALDVEDAAAAEALLAKLAGVVTRVKVGLELYTAEGPELVRRLVGRGLDVMLDLKLHGIPETVAPPTPPPP